MRPDDSVANMRRFLKMLDGQIILDHGGMDSNFGLEEAVSIERIPKKVEDRKRPRSNLVLQAASGR